MLYFSHDVFFNSAQVFQKFDIGWYLFDGIYQRNIDLHLFKHFSGEWVNSFFVINTWGNWGEFDKSLFLVVGIGSLIPSLPSEADSLWG